MDLGHERFVRGQRSMGWPLWSQSHRECLRSQDYIQEGDTV